MRPLSLSILIYLLVACGGAMAGGIASAPTLEDAGLSRCKVRKSAAKPLVVEWQSSQRASLELMTRKGVVVARYDGCEMRPLKYCRAPGKYGFAGVTAKRDTLRIQDSDELYASMPIGAASLEGTLEQSGELVVEMTLVGKFISETLSVTADELEGECDDATHVVVGLSVGAFEIFTSSAATAGAKVDIAGTGAGARTKRTRKALASDGKSAACEGATREAEQPPKGCSALIRLELAPIGLAGSAIECPEGSTWDGTRCAGAVAAGSESAEELACRKSDACKTYGLCSFANGGCTVPTTDGCAESTSCKQHGNCAAGKGRCIATDQEKCISSVRCKEDGECVLVQHDCRATTEHCVASANCSEWGRCTAVDGSCSAETDEDCKRSEACGYDGGCWAVDGLCGPRTDADCQASEQCRDSAGCTFHEEAGCILTSTADCRRAKGCNEDGDCTYVLDERGDDGNCQLADTYGCEHSAFCREDGECTWVTQEEDSGHCVVKSTTDCRRSETCKKHGRCTAVRSDDEDDPTLECQIRSNYGCQRTAECIESGSCSWNHSDESCAVASNADCKRSNECTNDGLCRFDRESGSCSE